MSTSGKRELLRLASILVRELKEAGVPLTYKNEQPLELEAIKGWWASLATWKGHPSLGMSVDHCLGRAIPSVWVGFWVPSSRRQLIDRLEEGLPEQLRSQTTLVDEDFLQGRRWRLLKSLSKTSLRAPIVEHYETFDSYFGIYDVNGPSGFDVVRATAFVRDVLYASDPSLGDPKRTAPPAKKAYMRYVQRFEVKIVPMHDKLQEKFEAFLRGSPGIECIIPNLGGVDLRYLEEGKPVLCEVKPCTHDTSRFAIRTAMGQLLDYRQKSPKAHMQILLSEKPGAFDAELALSNGFSLAYPSGRSFCIERRAERG